MTERAALLSRARKIAAHAAYETPEGQVARVILGQLLTQHPTLRAGIGWHVEGDGAAVRGAPRRSRSKRASEPKRDGCSYGTTPERRGSWDRPADPPTLSPPQIYTDQVTRTYVPLSRFQYHLVAALGAKHQVSVRYTENLYVGAPVRVAVTGPRGAVSAFATELHGYGSALETILDEVSAALVHRCIPAAPAAPSMVDGVAPNPSAPASDPGGSAWMRDALKWESRVASTRARLPMGAIREAAAVFVEVATRW